MVEEKWQKLDKQAKGQLIGPRQRCAVLKDEGYSRKDEDWGKVVPVLSRNLGLTKEQEDDILLASKKDSSERYLRQDEVVGNEATTRIIRYRTMCEGEKIHLVYGFCELAWQPKSGKTKNCMCHSVRVGVP